MTVEEAVDWIADVKDAQRDRDQQRREFRNTWTFRSGIAFGLLMLLVAVIQLAAAYPHLFGGH